MPAINVSSLNRAAQVYQPDFIVLPYTLLIPTLQLLGINMLEVANRDIVIVKERRGGLARPYTVGGTNSTVEAEISRMKERVLQTEFAFCSIKDNILNYVAKNVLYDASKNKINNKTKEHPYERDIIADQVITVCEDIIDALFHAERDAADLSPMGMFDGFNTLLDDLIVAGEISEAKGNLVACGSLAAPANDSDTTAYKSLKAWLRGVDEKLKNKPIDLQITPTTLLNVKDALENKKSSLKDVTLSMVQDYLREDCMLPNLRIISHYCLGTGSQLKLTTPGNFDLGMNTFSDVGFVQARNPYEDANLVQFWMQWQIGARTKNLHKRGFMISDGTNVANELSGDYNVSE
jgi:hypothetical protein